MPTWWIRRRPEKTRSPGRSSDREILGSMENWAFELWGSGTSAAAHANRVSPEQSKAFGPTAAHRSLPMGAIVRVVNLRTGKGRIVRINDRGPFIDGREIDVSYHVAQSLGFAEQGLAKVRIELLEVPQTRWPARAVAN